MGHMGSKPISVTYWKSDQMILCGVFDPCSRVSCTIAFIYAHNTEIQQMQLWRELVNVLNNPLVVSSLFVALENFN